MANISKIKTPDNTEYSLKDTEAREMLETKMPIYTIGTPTVLVNTTTVSFSKDGDNSWYISGENPISLSISSSDIENSIFFIEWDNVEYKLFMKLVEETRPVRGVTGSGYFDWWAIGNISTIGYGSTLADIEAPFAVTVDYMKNAGERYIISYDTAVSHTIKISKASFTKTVCDPAYYADTRHTGYPPIRFTSNKGSVAECGATKSSGSFSHAEGVATVASGDYSHAEGYGTTASGTYGSHAEGAFTTASGQLSHAEGYKTTASGNYSHAEGYGTTVSGTGSHAEGYYTIVSGGSSHAEGSSTTASGNLSHAEGEYTIANHRSQHVFGKANVEDPSTEAANKIGNYVEIVGNGTWETSGSVTVITRSNARTLDWSGNEVLAGSVTANGGFIGNLTGNASSATNASTVNNLTVQTAVPANAVFTDTKNTAGSTDTSSKIYLVGATSQAANPQTYSDNEVYTTSGTLTTNKVQVGGGNCTLEYNTSTASLDFIFS